MEFKGTKGKWELIYNDIQVKNQLIICAYGFDVKGRYTITDETKANALLISKAPEMLRELKNCLMIIRAFNDEHTQIEILNNLIKEATEL